MEQKQLFNTFDTFSVVTLILGVFLLAGTIVSNAMTDNKEDRAKIRSHQLAMQILVGGLKKLNQKDVNSSVRSLASINKLDLRPVGRIGMDPWGNPYQYVIDANEEGKSIIFVFSYGPNRIKETHEGLIVHGDDIGSMVLSK